MILEIGPCLEAYLADFVAIQTHLSRHFLLAIDFPGPRRSGSWLQIFNQPQEIPEQASRYGNLGQLESDIATML
jgi:hypothetical protein